MTRPARIILLVLALAATPAAAHRASDGFLTLMVDGARVTGQLELALRDVALLTALDADGDRELRWGELRGAEAALRAQLAPRLSLHADGHACELALGELMLNDRVDGRYAWWPIRADCPAPPAELAVGYRVLFEQDPGHRGLLALTRGGDSWSQVFEPARAGVAVVLAEPSRLRQFVSYLREGVHHIWIGADHILFLVTLLLPCVLLRRDAAWQAAPALRPVLWDVLRVVTAFTLAHSVTLTLSALGLLRLPPALTETVIALSVVAAALNNVRPVVTRGRWIVTFAFGLIHGFGFASVLGELGLPPGARAVALAGFNVGVELGQLAIVAAVVPPIFALRGTRAYPRLMQGVSIAVAVLGAIWALERSGLAG